MGGLRRDPVFVAAVAVVGCQALASFVLPLTPAAAGEASWYGDFVLVGLGILAAWRAGRADRAAGGRRFWRLFGASLVVWLLVMCVWQFLGESWQPGAAVLSDSLFLVYYFGLILATAVKPHDRRQPPWSPIVVTETAAGLVLAFGLLAYFAILPSRITPKSYATYVPSLTLYVTMDVILAARVATWCRADTGRRWLGTYRALAVAFVATLIHDLHELRVYTEGHNLETSLWDFVWWTQFVATVAAASLARHACLAAHAPDDEEQRSAVGASQAIVGPVASFAFVLPVLHLGGQVIGVSDPALDGSRDRLVLACAVVLGGLAVLHHRLASRRFSGTRESLYDAQLLLQQSRKMEALGRLAGGITHEFNNLLSVIIGYSDLLADRLGPSDRSAEAVQQVRAAAERAAALTRQLATFSRGPLGHETLIDVDRTIEALSPMIGRMLGEAVSVDRRPAPQDVWIAVDPGQFERAVLNLVVNAREAMPAGGVFRMETRALLVTERDSSRVGSLLPGPYVELTVGDSGDGMDDDTRSRLFEPFFTTKDRSSHRGLGLAFVYGIVRQASGHIEVNSTPGQGTVVELYFPRRNPPVRSEEASAVARRANRALTVLLAEDETGLRRLMRTHLEEAGFVVLEAADGPAAVGLAQQHSGAIDLLISDIVMPGFSGPEVARRVVAERPETRVLYITGYAPEALGDLHVAGSVFDLLPKPFAMAELVERGRALVAGPDAPGPGPGPGGGRESSPAEEDA